MPDLDGFEAAAIIRQGERNKNTPIIFLTAGDETEALRGYAVGAVDYVLKPINVEILRSKVSVFVELARTTAVVREQTEQLKVVNRELEGFCYSISHDLRAPLRAIDAFSHILHEEYGQKLDERGGELIGKVVDNARRMGKLIDDLLEFSRLGRSWISAGEIDMAALAREVMEEIGQLPGLKMPRCVLEPMPAAWGDRSLVRQVWINLLSNAVKFTGATDAPLIQAGGVAGSRENAYYVRDNGAGFDMRYYDKLFGVFQRLHSVKEFPGTGVGLAIVQRVVGRLGGRVWAESKEREGATFHFTLPKAGDRSATSPP
jgi:light-regulated signal transduction histidine kinase (bacteriophytochrome)